MVVRCNDFNPVWSTNPQKEASYPVQVRGFFNVPCWPYNTEDAGDGAYDLSSLAKKTRTSNHLQISLQRQHVLLGLVWGLNPGPPARQSGALPTELTSAHEKYIP